MNILKADRCGDPREFQRVVTGSAVLIEEAIFGGAVTLSGIILPNVRNARDLYYCQNDAGKVVAALSGSGKEGDLREHLIRYLAVAPNFRRRSLGSQLVGAFALGCAYTGSGPQCIRVAATNTLSTTQFYERNGFKCVDPSQLGDGGEIVEMYGNAWDIVEAAGRNVDRSIKGN